MHLYTINTDLSDIWKVIYPVGSLYMSVNNTNPSTLFGGTWSMLTGGYVLKTIDSGTGGSTNSAGNTGSTILTAAQSGLRAHYHTPGTLSASSDGAHSHTGFYHLAPMSGNNGYPLCEFNASGASASMTITNNTGAHTHPITGATEYNTNENATEGHNHTAGMPQNIGVYVWKRTA